MLGHRHAPAWNIMSNTGISLLRFRMFWLAAGDYAAGVKAS
jgi:hypothetical protein